MTMSYERLERMRELSRLESAKKTAKKELADVLREVRDSQIPALLKCSVNPQLIISAREHREAITVLLDNLRNSPEEDVSENLELIEKALGKIREYEEAKQAVREFNPEDDAA